MGAVFAGAAQAPITSVLIIFERTIRNALEATPGIQNVAVDIPAKRVRVTYDESRIEVDQMKAILRQEDYPVASAERA